MNRSIPVYPGLLQSLLLLLALVILEIGLSVAGTVALMAVGALSGHPFSPDDSIQMALLTMAVVTVSYAILLLWGIYKTKAPFQTLCPLGAFPAKVVLPMLIVSVGIGILLSEADNVLRYFLPMPAFLAGVFKDLYSGNVGSLLILVVVAPLSEELFFRGLILRGLRSRYSDPKAVAVSALLFALVHLNPYQFLGPLILGLLAGWIFVKTGSLWPCMLLHAFNNGQGWLVQNVLNLEIPGYSMPDTVPLPHVFQPLWFDLLGVAFTAAGVLLLGVTLRRPRPAPGSVRF